MNKTLKVTKELIHWLEEFSQENLETEISLESFIIWLNSRLFEDRQRSQHGQDHGDLDMEVSFLLSLQNRHYKAYAKNALIDSDLSSPEGFSFLYHLNMVESFRKMELIKMHQLEPPSGIEVLKRLIHRKFIEEFDDPDDKRARRIRISETGKQKLQSLLPKMQEVFSSMTAELSLNEKIHLISFLRQMNDYHLKLNTK